MVTIKDIAERLGLAVSTVSKGLNGAEDISAETRQLVLDTAVEMGYSLKKIKRNAVDKVCIFIESANMAFETNEQFGYEIVNGFKQAALTRGWEVVVEPSELNFRTLEKYDSYMLKHGYSGAFLLGFTLHDDWIRQLEKTGVPTVLLDNFIENNEHVGYVGTDSREGIEQAVTHLASKGHRKIAFLNGTKNSMVSNERDLAFRMGMKANDIPVDEDLVAYGYYVPDCAKSYVKNFTDKGATAVLCASDLIASGVVNELNRLGKKVPQDVAVIGFDDLPIAEEMSPRLTTIRQDRKNLGKSAALMLDGLIRNVPMSKLLLRSKLIIRESV
ncbi:MAG: LacI family transcriptional regulator [Lachnospiraceae bacterium]|nr:LacI family transcriptional regulator [Lachnospiraceae bacterium]